MYETVQFTERSDGADPSEVVLGEFDTEIDAVEAARTSRGKFLETGSDDYAWWIVREQGARLSTFIADSRSDKEFVLDLRSGELIEVRS